MPNLGAGIDLALETLHQSKREIVVCLPVLFFPDVPRTNLHRELCAIGFDEVVTRSETDFETVIEIGNIVGQEGGKGTDFQPVGNRAAISSIETKVVGCRNTVGVGIKIGSSDFSFRFILFVVRENLKGVGSSI